MESGNGGNLKPRIRAETRHGVGGEVERRSAGFPLLLGSAAVATAAVVVALGAAVATISAAFGVDPASTGASVVSGVHAGLLAIAATIAAGGALAIAAGIQDIVQLRAALKKGKGTTNQQFDRFLRAELIAGRLDPGLAARIVPYQPSGRFDLTFGYSAGGMIAVRPELIASPALFRKVVLHEFHHMRSHAARGPPGLGWFKRLWRFSRSELAARNAERSGEKGLREAKIPALERSLRQAQLSLERGNPYEVLVVNPNNAELADPGLYQVLSRGQAAVRELKGLGSREALEEAKGLYEAVVLGRSWESLPDEGTPESKKLELGLRQLDELYLIATRGIATEPSSFKADSELGKRVRELAAEARASAATKSASPQLEQKARELWREVSAQRLAGLGVTKLVDSLYSRVADRGIAFLEFGPADRGLETWERLLRFWEAADGGQFKLARVDFEDGGHILVLRKLENRVGLWLRPVPGGRIESSVPEASGSPANRAAARKALESAGFGEHLPKFEELGVEVQQVFGADVGRQEIFVTVQRRHQGQLAQFVTASSIRVETSEAEFQPELYDSLRVHNVRPVHALGVDGAGEELMVIDTGVQLSHSDFYDRVESIDLMKEGHEDWNNHGTHDVGSIGSANAAFPGMAPGARVIMAKVFGRDAPGAVDGTIMAAATLGWKRGVTVINASVGIRGNSGSNLAMFMSELSRRVNGKGEMTLVVASAGNAGFDKSLSQPGAGDEVLSVGAAIESGEDGPKEDGPEGELLLPAFFLAAGPDEDPRVSIRRYRLGPKITGRSGNIVTDPGDPNVYKKGVYSARSKDAPPAHADTADGQHTGLAGTSMAAPAVAGIAALVRSALRRIGKIPFLEENMPLVLRAILMGTAKDLGVPIWYQGAGLVDAKAAIELVLGSVVPTLRLRLSRVPGLGWLTPPGDAGAFAWIANYKRVLQIEDEIYQAAEIAKVEARARLEEALAPDDGENPEARRQMGDAVASETAKKFGEARDRLLPELTALLKDPVWLVRMQAALALLNVLPPGAPRSKGAAADEARAKRREAVQALGDKALNDADGRVRQMAFLALAEIPTHSEDLRLQAAAADPRWDAGIYGAYALARRGDRGGVARIVAETKNPDKRARFSAVWLLGQLGSRATAVESETLSAKVRDESERGTIRHRAAVALFNLAESQPESISAKVIVDLLESAGAQNLALTRTISKFFPAAIGSRPVIEMLRKEPLRETATRWVLSHRGSAEKPGALGEMVSLLARVLDVPLDLPTRVPLVSGLGVAGVDAAMGPLDLFVEPVSALEPALLARFGAVLQAELPLMGAAWVKVPEHKLHALRHALTMKGARVRLAVAAFPLTAGAPAVAGAVISLDDPKAALPALPRNGSVLLRASKPVSEAHVALAIERLAAEAKRDRSRPIVAALGIGLASRPDKSRLAELVDRAALEGLGLVLPAGDGGARHGTLWAPSAGLVPVIAAASRTGGLQFYSSRARRDGALAWTELVDEFGLPELALAGKANQDGGVPAAVAVVGTGAAAERSAVKAARLAAELAEAFARAGRPVPEGWFFLVNAAIRRSLEPMPGLGAAEVGGGLFSDADAASRALAETLKDLDAAEKSAQDAAAAAGRPPSLPALGNALPAGASAAAKSAGHAVESVTIIERIRRIFRSSENWFDSLAAPVDAPEPGETGEGPAKPAWWQDRSVRHAAVSLPLYALRRDSGDPGIGKFADLGRYYREALAPQGVGVVALLPHFDTLDESPYAPVSLYSINEDDIDWSQVDEVKSDPLLLEGLRAQNVLFVEYDDVRHRELAVAVAAWRRFASGALAEGGARAKAFESFLRKNNAWLDEYAEFTVLAERISRPALEWTAAEIARARAFPGFQDAVAAHRFAQWIASIQLKEALDAVHAAGGRVLFDVPMFRPKNGVDAWKRPEYFTDLKTRNPGIINRWVHEDWKDLALWNWTKLKKDNYALALDPYRHWLELGFDGARVDALHFAYKFGNGQLASGDEPGEDYLKALAAVFAEKGALPLAEAFEGKDSEARRFGFLTVGGEWKSFSTHDDARKPGFLPSWLGSRDGAFSSYTLGDEWADPFPVKEMRDGRSLWRYRIPLPADADYKNRVRLDARPQLRMLTASAKGDPLGDQDAARAVMVNAADSFVKRNAGGVEIWAASLDWFQEPWGRDSFISLSGLLLSTGRYEDAKSVIRGFAARERGGIIPNRIADLAQPEYNTVDGSLWLIQAISKTVEASGDRMFLKDMLPVIDRIIAGYSKGTEYARYGRKNRIYMDEDGLIVSPAQATWMDADPDGRDRPVTPRNGKAVEINALWYSALRFAAAQHRGAKARRLAELADRIKDSFNEKFWFETQGNRDAWGNSGGALYDVVEGDPHGAAIRPNMVFAVSHGGDLLSPERRRAVVLAATRDLLTPYGLRTLSPRDSHYRARYDTEKPPIEKDQAYHQGTAWPWLIGPYADALARVREDQGWDAARIRAERAALLAPLLGFMAGSPEGSLPELFDGGKPIERLVNFSLDDPQGLAGALAGLPRTQNRGGTRSQAWSVAEVLRALSERRLLSSTD